MSGKWKGLILSAALIAAVALAVALLNVPGETPEARTYGTNVYMEQGGAKLVVASGGEIQVESGGELDIQSGATTGWDAAMDLDSTLNVDGATTLNGTVTINDNAVITGTSDLQGNIADSGGDLTIADNVVITGTLNGQGAADFDSTLNVDGATTLVGALTLNNNATITGTLNAQGAVDFDSTLNVDGAATLNGVVTLATDTEHVGALTVDSVDVITSTNGAIATVGASEVWLVHAVYCHVTTSFDCSGDDCVLQIGDGDDPNGYLDLIDGELQTGDSEMTGAPTGWQGFSSDTQGAFLASGLPFVEANDTIDILIEDSSASTDPTAGAAVCYIYYMRIE